MSQGSGFSDSESNVMLAARDVQAMIFVIMLVRCCMPALSQISMISFWIHDQHKVGVLVREAIDLANSLKL